MRKRIKRKQQFRGWCDEGRGGEHPPGACYTVPGSPGLEQKQLDQTSMNEGGSTGRWKDGGRISRSLCTVAGEVDRGRLTELRKHGRKEERKKKEGSINKAGVR